MRVGAAPGARDVFTFTGVQQDFIVPAGVTTLTVEAPWAQAGQGGDNGGAGGNGGTVTATINVTPGETLAVFVGGQGETGGSDNSQPGAGGFKGATLMAPAVTAAAGAAGPPTSARGAPRRPTGWSWPAAVAAVAARRSPTRTRPTSRRFRAIAPATARS